MGQYLFAPAPAPAHNTPPVVKKPLTDNFIQELSVKFPNSKLDGVSFCRKVIKLLLEKEKSLTTIASFGDQSLGKSYFLNNQFGAKFEYKLSADHGKCTNIASTFVHNQLFIVDLEGVDSIGVVGNGNDSKGSTNKAVDKKEYTMRENQNLTLSLAFSDIFLFHIQHKNLNSKFIDRFAYSFWNALRHLSKNNRDLPKIIILIRDPMINHNLDDFELNKSFQDSIKKFEGNVNSKLREYNDGYFELIQRDSKYQSFTQSEKENYFIHSYN